MRSVVERCAPASVQASGGIRSLGDARALLAAGADRVIVGTAAWPDPTPWLALGEGLVLALDVDDGQLRSRGWTEAAGLSFTEALRRASGARVLVTAIERDGTLAGPDLELVAKRPPRVYACWPQAVSGRRRTSIALADAGAEAVVVGRALLVTESHS